MAEPVFLKCAKCNFVWKLKVCNFQLEVTLVNTKAALKGHHRLLIFLSPVSPVAEKLAGNNVIL